MQWGTKSSRVSNVPINLIIQAMNPLTKIIWKSHRFSMYALGQAKIKLKLTEELKREREREKSAQKILWNSTSAMSVIFATASSKSALKNHMKDYQEKEVVERLKCKQCSYQSSNKSNLTQHVNRVHEKIRDSMCEEYERFYSSPGIFEKAHWCCSLQRK